jgi:hypothetical protein
VQDVKFSRELKWLVAIMLPLSLAWKLTVAADTDDHQKFEIVAFLTRQGFHAVANEDLNGTGIQAVSGNCQMRVIKYDGGARDIIRDLMAATDRLIFIHRGKVSLEQPNFRTTLDDLWTRSLRKIGLANHQPPVLAVLASAECNADQLPWEELQ